MMGFHAMWNPFPIFCTFDIKAQKWYYIYAGAIRFWWDGDSEGGSVMKNEMTFRQMRAAIRKEMKKVISIDETKEIYVGDGVVDSEWHFDWFAVTLTGTWLHDKVAKKWGYIRENEKDWQWFGEDEVTVPAICYRG